MSARAELAEIYLSTLNAGHGVMIRAKQADVAADAILAAGYRKPRTIATAEELDALGFGVAVLDASKRVWTNDGDSLDQWGCVRHDDYPRSLVWRGSADIALPATVLYEPAP